MFSPPIKASHPTSPDSKGGDIWINENEDRHVFVRLNKEAQSSHTTVLSPVIQEDTQEQLKCTSHVRYPNGRWLSAKWGRDKTESVPCNDLEMQTAPTSYGRSVNVQNEADVY